MVRNSWNVPDRPRRLEGREDELEHAASLSDIARTFPACAHRPIDDWLKQSKCHSGNYACFCADDRFISTMHSALDLACAIDAQRESVLYFRRLCAGVGIELPASFRMRARQVGSVTFAPGQSEILDSTVGPLQSFTTITNGLQTLGTPTLGTPTNTPSNTPGAATTSRSRFPTFTPPSSSSTSSTPSQTASGSASGNQNEDSGGLSSSAKIGIGVGVGVGGALLIAVIAFLIYRLMKQRKEHEIAMSEQRGWEPGVSMRNF